MSNIRPSIESLLERGYGFLEASEFRSANLYFNRVLDIDPHNHRAYFGLSLVEYQCRTESELYHKLCLPLSLNPHFNKAIQYAEGSDLDRYNAINERTHIACVGKIIKNLNDGETYLTENWFKHYTDSSAKNEKCADALRSLLENHCKHSDKAYCTLVEIYSLLFKDRSENDLFTNVASEISKCGCSNMNAILAQIKVDFAAKTMNDTLVSFWANPQNANPEDIALQPPVIFCDDLKTVASRYEHLANLLETDCYTSFACESADKFYKKALAFCRDEAETARVTASRNAFFEFTVGHSKVTESVRAYILSLPYASATIYYQCIRSLTENFAMLIPFRNLEKEVSDFLSKGYKSYSSKDVDKMKEQLQNASRDQEEYCAQHIAKIKPYVEKAETFDDSTTVSKLKKDWDQYLHYLHSTVADNNAFNQKLLTNIDAKLASDAALERKSSRKQATSTIIGGLFLLPFTIVPLLTVRHFTHDLRSIITMPLFLILIAAVVVTVVYHIILGSIIKSIFKKNYYKVLFVQKLIGGIIKTANVMLTILTIASAVFSFINYPKTLGVISIKTAEEFNIIKNIPRCDFVLENDIDFQGTPVEPINTFYGTLEGNNYRISNAAIDLDSLFSTNNGSINNLIIDNAAISTEGFSLTKVNEGSVIGCTVTNLNVQTSFCYNGFAKENHGSIVSCSTNNLQFENITEFTGICKNNYGKIQCCQVADVTAIGNENTQSMCSGIADSSYGEITACSVDGSFQAYSSYGIIRYASGNCTIDRCQTAGKFQASSYIAGLVGQAQNVTVTNSCSTAKLTLAPTSNSPLGSVIGGLLGESSPSGEDERVTVNNCYFAGTLVAKKSKSSNKVTYGYCGSFIAKANVANSLELNKANVMFSSCFSIAKEDLDIKQSESTKDDEHVIEFDNCCATDTLLHPKKILNDTTVSDLTKKKILKSKNLLETLCFDPEIWEIEGGELPTLKPYELPPEAITDQAETTNPSTQE